MTTLFSAEDIVRTLIKTDKNASASDFVADLLDISPDKLYEIMDEYENTSEEN